MRKLSDFADRYGMLPSGSLILCAVSGGADSMCLLCVLDSLSAGLNIKVAAAHYNHRLRGAASDSDEAFVRGFCLSRGIPFYSGSGDVKAAAASHRRGIEETAREMRYGFLERTAESIGASRIATAHTQNDNAETVIMNLIRGAGLNGLSGIPPVRGNIVRPLLATSRGEIMDYLRDNNIPHIEDETNKDLKYTRNKIRHTVMPVLCGINPKFPAAVSETAFFARADNEYLTGLAEDSVSGAKHKDGVWSIGTESISGLPLPLSGRAAIILMEKAGVPKAGISSLVVESMLALASGADPSARLSLPGGFTAERSYSELVISRGKPENGFEPAILNLNGETSISASGKHIICEYVDKINEIYNSLNTFCIKYDIISGKVTARPKKTGDRITLPGRGGSKSLKKLFIDEKIPLRERLNIPVIADDKDVIALSGFGINQKYEAEKGCAAIVIKILEAGTI